MWWSEKEVDIWSYNDYPTMYTRRRDSPFLSEVFGVSASFLFGHDMGSLLLPDAVIIHRFLEMECRFDGGFLPA
jgi:hypothetical protein